MNEEKSADRSSNFVASTCEIDYYRLSRRDRRVFEASAELNLQLLCSKVPDLKLRAGSGVATVI